MHRARHYGSRVRTLLRSLWRLPAPVDRRGLRNVELGLVVLFGVAGLLEVLLDDDLAWRWLSLGGFLIWLPTLLVRRTHPLVPPVVFTAVTAALAITGAVSGSYPSDLDAGIVALVIPFSLARWARGRDAVIGITLFLVVAGTALVGQDLAAGDRIGGTAVVMTAIALGAVFRSRAMLQARQLDDVRQHERERLARDLHDTVAHHLTAIAITAQAGLAVADSQPGAATDALRRIDEEAGRTLAETRKVLRMLRTADEVPDRPLDDLAGLASPAGHVPRVTVDLGAGLDDMPATVAAAAVRIAREAVANARRHATDATVVAVRVERVDGDVLVDVTDDGRASTRAGDGFGIIGMTERATLLGGTLDAGPMAPTGWRVRAALPMEDVT